MFAPILIALAALAILYGVLVRPRMLDVGSTPQERYAPLPGDDVIPEADTVTTRAITINAPASDVWPWVVPDGPGPGRLLHPQLGRAPAPVRHPRRT